MMLRHLGERARRMRIERAVHAALADPAQPHARPRRHGDLDRFTDAVIERLG